MPPFHRMPVVYVAVGLLAIACGVGSLFQGGEGGPDFRDGTHRAEDDRSDRVLPPSSGPSSAGDGIERTSEGLRRKVLVRSLGLRPLTRPEQGASPSGPPLDYFSIHFVFEESSPFEPGGTTFLRVGPAGGPPIGWVPADAVLAWDTRLMALPTPREGRPPLVVFRDRSCLLEALAGRDCPDHDGPCPTEGEEPDATPADAPDVTLGMPILRSEAIPQPDGNDRTIFEVAALVDDRAPPPPPPDEPPDHLRRLLGRTYIAFVIDTTSSMQAHIDAARELAGSLAVEAERPDATLRLALVAYRDDHPAFGYVSRIVSPFTTPSGFRAGLDRIEAARRGDGTVDEAVFEGVAAALPAPPDEPAGVREHLRWPSGREGDLATKLLVLIGDAPDHARDLDRARALAGLAREARITIVAVSIPRDDLRGDEPDRYRDQWDALAAGSYRPPVPAAGFDAPIAPVRPTLADPSALAPTLRAIIDDRAAYARELAALLEAEAEGRLRSYVDGRGLTLDRVAPVLVDLHRGGPRDGARPDPRLDGRKAPSIRSGWIAERSGDVPMVSVQMLMSRGELGLLIDELDRFRLAVEAGPADPGELLRIGRAAATGESAFLDADRGPRTFAEHLHRDRGLPPPRAGGLLDRSQADLLQADPAYRAAVSDRLARGIALLAARRDAIAWDDPAQTASGMTLVPFEAVDY